MQVQVGSSSEISQGVGEGQYHSCEEWGLCVWGGGGKKINQMGYVSPPHTSDTRHKPIEDRDLCPLGILHIVSLCTNCP